jgi:hypothetical protein
MGFMGLKPKHFLRCVGLDKSHKVTRPNSPLASPRLLDVYAFR